MAKNRVFFPQEALDAWLTEERVELKGDELVLKAEGRVYRLTEAVRVVREVTGSPDAYDLVGRVKSKVYLEALESELLGTSMILGDNAYDVVPGFVGLPVGAAPVLEASKGARPATDEDLLGRFLLREL